MSRVKNVKNSKNLTSEQLENKYKQCNKCKEVKLKETEFYTASYGDGYYGECKECRIKRSAEKYHSNGRMIDGKYKRSIVMRNDTGRKIIDPIREIDKLIKQSGGDWLSWIKKEHIKKWGDWHEKYCKG